MNINQHNQGIAILSSVFVLASIITVAVLGQGLLSTNQSFDSVDTEAGLRAQANADMAIKEALLRLSRDYTYQTASGGNDVSELRFSSLDSASFRVIHNSLNNTSRVIVRGQSGQASKNSQVLVEFDKENLAH